MSIVLASVAGGLVCFLVCAAVALRENRRIRRKLQASSRYNHDLTAFETEAGKQGQPGSIPIMPVDPHGGSTPLVYHRNSGSPEPNQTNSRTASWPADVIVRNEMLATFGESSPCHVESPSARISASEDQYAQLENRLAVAPAAKANSQTMARVHSAANQRAHSIDPQTVALNWLRGEPRLTQAQAASR